jgi:uncharacterized membrane protein YjjP (DUF1212 family)
MKIAIPQLILGSLAAGLIGSIIHLLLGGKILRLVFSLVFSWIGFWVGHSIANRYRLFYFRYGTINFGIAAISAVALGLFGFWIAGENKKDKEDIEK